MKWYDILLAIPVIIMGVNILDKSMITKRSSLKMIVGKMRKVIKSSTGKKKCK